MINLLHVITELELGGAQKLTLEILKRLNIKEFKIFLLSSPKGLLVNDAKNLQNTSVFLNFFLKRNINPIYDFISFIIIYFYILKNRIEIVHTHSSKAGILGRCAAKLAGVPVIIHTYHGFGFNSRQNWIVKNFFILLEKIVSKFTDKLVFVSENNKLKAERLKIGNKNKNVLIYGAIEKNQFLHKKIDSSAIKNKFGIEKRDKVIGMIAPLKPQKAPLDFIKIANIVKDEFSEVKFLLIGEGFLRKKAENKIKELKLDNFVSLLGWRRDVDKLIPIFDVAILTSYWEGLPHFLVEAMMCKKPLVAFGIDGVCDIIKDSKNGFIIPVGNTTYFAEKVIKLLKNDSLIDKMGEYGYESIKDKFDIKETVLKTEILYTNLIEYEKNICKY